MIEGNAFFVGMLQIELGHVEFAQVLMSGHPRILVANDVDVVEGERVTLFEREPASWPGATRRVFADVAEILPREMGKILRLANLV